MALAQPNDRSHIERFFHLVSRLFARQLPRSLGSDPSAIERALSDPKGDLHLLVDLDELKDILSDILLGWKHTNFMRDYVSITCRIAMRSYH